MSPPAWQCIILQCGYTLPSLYPCPMCARRGTVAGSPSPGLGLAMRTGGKLRKHTELSTQCRSERVSAGDGNRATKRSDPIPTSRISRGPIPVAEERTPAVASRWVVAALAAMATVMAGAAEEPAMAFGWFGQQQPAVEKDPVEPFTLYGSIFKKYLIEDIVEGKVVGRKKGFTASACVNALDASKETPELQGVPAGLKVTIIGEPSCSKGEGQTRDESCTAPCRKACQTAVARHVAEVKDETGYVLDRSDITKATEACSLQCFNECTKPGKSISFVFPFRPH